MSNVNTANKEYFNIEDIPLVDEKRRFIEEKIELAERITRSITAAEDTAHSRAKFEMIEGFVRMIMKCDSVDFERRIARAIREVVERFEMEAAFT